MQTRCRSLWRLAAAGLTAVALAAVVALTGCESDDDDYDHSPPAGQGTLVVDNETFDDISIFVDGVSRGRVTDGNEAYVDVEPGLHRIVLSEEDDGDRSYRDDVDVLEGRLTILRVRSSSDDDYRVSVSID